MSTVFKVSQLPPAPLPLQSNDDYFLVSRPAVGETYKTTLNSLSQAVGSILGISSSDASVFSSLSPIDGQVLTYNGTSKKWVAADPTGGSTGGTSTVNIVGDVTYNSISQQSSLVKRLNGFLLDFTNTLNLFYGNRIIGTTPTNTKSVYDLNSKGLSEGDVLAFTIDDDGNGAFIPQNMFGMVVKSTTSPMLSGGYQWLPSGPSGLLAKWGICSITVGSSLPDVTTITIPSAGTESLGPSYQFAPYAVFTSIQSTLSATCVVNNLDKNSFDLRIWAAAGTYKVSWLTLGL